MGQDEKTLDHAVSAQLHRLLADWTRDCADRFFRLLHIPPREWNAKTNNNLRKTTWQYTLYSLAVIQYPIRMEFKQKIVLVDGHALLHRAFHALPGLTNPEGFPTGAIYGFFSIFFKALEQIKPAYVAVTFDLSEITFRNKLSGDYKAHRKPAPDDLVIQLPKVKEILTALDIPIYEKGGYEADDIIGIITRKTPKNVLNIILTGDMDLLQLINENTVVYRLKTGITDFVVYDIEKMKTDYGLTPEQWVHLKALKGDASDNIPGVAGVGEKTALDLIQRYRNIDNLYEAVEKKDPEIKQSVLNKLIAGKHYAYLSYKLALIDCEKYKFDEFDLERTRVGDYDQSKAIELFQQLNIKSLIQKLPKTKIKAQAVTQQKIGDERFELVDTVEKLEDLIQLIEKKKAIAIDTVTTVGRPLDAELVGLSIAVNEGEVYYIPVYQKKELNAIDALKGVLENPRIEKWGNEIKTDALVLKKYGVNLYPFSFDTNIAAYLLNPGQRSYDTESLGFAEFGMRRYAIEKYAGKAKDVIPFETLEIAEVCKYGCEDAETTFRLKPKLEKQLKEKGLAKIFDDIEMPLIPVLMKMEELGVVLDVKYLNKLSDTIGKQIDSLEKKIHKLAGYEFNISSPVQLRDALFGKLQIPTTELRKRGKSGGLSTAAGELEKLRGLHPVIDHVFEYRELTKLKSTYLDALPELVSKLDKRLHTTYNQTIAATGRLSSIDPNLQNIPIRTELGRSIRKGFVAAPGYVLASIDYSQIELRIAASLSGDPEMIKIFKSGKDFHMATAARIFGVMESSVTPDQRRAAKTINFSVLYGVSAFGLSERSDMGRAEAGDFIKRYYQVFAKLKQYIDNTIEKAHKDGFVTNAIGRIRYFPEINASNFAIRAGAERAAFNMPIQSMNADIIKMAMREIDEKLVNGDVRMLLQVHDELVFEIKKGREKDVVKKIKEIMESSYKLKVPIVAEAKIGQNWLEMEKI
ncbi:MAG TPA: DNA polymerase I [Candidatus Binatia bacterium]|nr:DNA polymerase I [Candidatus Binatia bacterium]